MTALSHDAQGRDAQGRDAQGRDARGPDAQGRDARGRYVRGPDAWGHPALCLTAPACVAPDPLYPLPDIELAASLGVLSPEAAASEAFLAQRVRRGLWQRLGRVVVMHNGPLTEEQAVWVAILRAPRGSVLAGGTVLARSRLRWAPPARLQLLSPYAGPTAALPGVQARRSKVLGPEDVHPTAQPPQSRLPRAVLDHMRSLRRPDDVRAVLCAPIQQRLVLPEHLLVALDRLGAVRHRALAVATLADISGGSHSTRELGFLRVIRAAGLPDPDRQLPRTDRNGRRYLDAVWERWGLHVEVDGLGHLLIAVWSADCDRSNELELGKQQERRLRVPGFWLDDRPTHVADQVRRGLLAGGWPG